MTALVLSVVLFGACGGDDSSSTTTTDPRLIGPPASIPTTDPEAPFALADLTEPYGCGFGFQVGNDDQTIGLFVTTGGGYGEPPSEDSVDLATEDGPWSAEIRFGRDLFANWCDDVIEPGEPEPFVGATWTVTAGTLTITQADAATSQATLEATGLVAADADGNEYEVGDITVVNTSWGMFAG